MNSQFQLSDSSPDMPQSSARTSTTGSISSVATSAYLESDMFASSPFDALHGAGGGSIVDHGAIPPQHRHTISSSSSSDIFHSMTSATNPPSSGGMFSSAPYYSPVSQSRNSTGSVPNKMSKSGAYPPSSYQFLDLTSAPRDASVLQSPGGFGSALSPTDMSGQVSSWAGSLFTGYPVNVLPSTNFISGTNGPTTPGSLNGLNGGFGAPGNGGGPIHSSRRSSASTTSSTTSANYGVGSAPMGALGPITTTTPASLTSPPTSLSANGNGNGVANGNGTPRSKLAPKPKFSQEDDDLLIDLKENQKLTWRQIAEHFDGRTAGALQVRYCTRLKSRSLNWPDSDVDLLAKAADEYEEERWNFIASKLGGRYPPQVCKEKFKQVQHQRQFQTLPSSTRNSVSASSRRGSTPEDVINFESMTDV